MISQPLCFHNFLGVSTGFSQYVFTAWWKIRSNFMSCRYCFWWWFPVSSDVQFHFLWPDKSIQLRKCSKVSCWLTSNPVAKCTPVAQLNHLFVACQLIHASNATSNLDPQISWWWWFGFITWKTPVKKEMNIFSTPRINILDYPSIKQNYGFDPTLGHSS